MERIFLASAEGGHEGADVFFSVLGLEVTGAVVTMWVIMGVIILLALVAARSIQPLPRTRFQNMVEMAVEGGMDFFAGVLGPHRARQFFPLLGSFFVFILFANYSGLLPGAGMLPGFKPPTSHWGVTGGLAAVVFFTVQLAGIRAKGIGHFKHFFEPWFLTPIMLPLGVLEEFVRPFALSLRLFANIFGGETVLLALLASLPYFLPVGHMALELIFGFVQAIIFTLLTAVYLANATSEAEAH